MAYKKYIGELSEEERIIYGAIVLIGDGKLTNAIDVLSDLLDEGQWQD